MLKRHYKFIVAILVLMVLALAVVVLAMGCHSIKASDATIEQADRYIKEYER